MTAEPVHRWAADPEILADARSQAIPFAASSLIPDVAERAWSARVQAAVNGMDVSDRDGMDAWIEAHATHPEQHLLEAELVAAYETQVRDWTASMEAAWAAEELTDEQDDTDTDEL